MELEDGQIPSDDTSYAEQSYDPAYEWPGDTAVDSYEESSHQSTSSAKRLTSGQPVFRMVVLRTTIIPSKQKVAVIDAYPEVQFGRDVQLAGSTVPRIRLKEMEVSKLHATAYWDGARREWNIVDMGSKHGTFLLQGSTSTDLQNAGIRLSPPRVASIPRKLRHGDHLSMGGTTFEVHIHTDQRPCEGCSLSNGSKGIPLFPSSISSSSKRTREVAGLDSTENVERDPKKALNMLKRNLLIRHDAQPASETGTSKDYVDRAARRRVQFPGSKADSPGTVAGAAIVPERVPAVGVSQPPTPLSSTNIGHQLLMKQGWQPGNALGTPTDELDGRVALINPLEVKPSQERAGLGTTREDKPQMDWKERGKLRRFETVI